MYHSPVQVLHDSLIIWGRPIRRWYKGTVPMRRDVIRSEDIAASNARVGGHGGRLHVVLRIIQRVGAVSTVDAAVADSAVVVMRRSIQAGLRVAIIAILVIPIEII